MANFDEAEQSLSFAPVRPAHDPPQRIFVSRPEVPIAARGLLLLFSDSSGDPYWVIEESPSLTQEGLERAVEDCTPDVGCSSKSSLVTIRTEEVALLEVGNGTSLIWLEGALLFDVIGPETLTADEAIAIANDF